MSLVHTRLHAPFLGTASGNLPLAFLAAACAEVLLSLFWVVRVIWIREWIGIPGGLLRIAFMGLLAVAVVRRGSRLARWVFAGAEAATALICLLFALVTLPGGRLKFDGLMFALFVLYLALAAVVALPGRGLSPEVPPSGRG
jgi:hypothetical protein